MKCVGCDGNMRPKSAVVTLWDGQHYCRQCLDSAHAEFSEFVRSHPKFEETAPYNPVLVAKRHASVLGGFGVVIGFAMGYGAYGPAGLFIGVLGGVFVSCLAGVLQIPL